MYGSFNHSWILLSRIIFCLPFTNVLETYLGEKSTHILKYKYNVLPFFWVRYKRGQKLERNPQSSIYTNIKKGPCENLSLFFWNKTLSTKMSTDDRIGEPLCPIYLLKEFFPQTNDNTWLWPSLTLTRALFCWSGAI